nr:hypothetical protein [Tanacetum cinerariifolium]
KDHHQHLKRSGEPLESSELNKLKISHSTTQLAELQETTFISAGATISTSDPIPAVTSVSAGLSISAASSILAATPIAAGVSTTADDPKAQFKRYLRQASDNDEPVSLALVSYITTWEIIPIEFGHGEIHVITRADGSIIWDNQDQWQIQSWRFYALPAIHVLETEAGDIMYMFVDK